MNAGTPHQIASLVVIQASVDVYRVAGDGFGIFGGNFLDAATADAAEDDDGCLGNIIKDTGTIPGAAENLAAAICQTGGGDHFPHHVVLIQRISQLQAARPVIGLKITDGYHGFNSVEHLFRSLDMAFYRKV